MKLIKGYQQWLNEDVTTATTNPPKPGATPEGYTAKTGMVYKYPFKDDQALQTYYAQTTPIDANFVRDKLPSLAALGLNLNFQEEATGTGIITLLKKALSAQLNISAIYGYPAPKKSDLFAQMAAIQVPGDNLTYNAAKKDGATVKEFLAKIKETTDFSKNSEAYQKIVDQWDTAFATIWNEQVKKAGLNFPTA